MSSSTIRVVVPVPPAARSVAGAAPGAPARAVVAVATVAFLDNGKPKADVLLGRAAAAVERAAYATASWRKPSPSAAARTEVVASIGATAAYCVTALGD